MVALAKQQEGGKLAVKEEGDYSLEPKGMS